jgi:DNA-binding PadR family transcriptional regulator
MDPSAEPRVNRPVLKLVRYFMNHLGDDAYALDIIRSTGINSGTLYPLFDHLERCKLLSSRWEEADPGESQRPRRRLYRLTGTGVTWVNRVCSEHERQGVWAWNPI